MSKIAQTLPFDICQFDRVGLHDGPCRFTCGEAVLALGGTPDSSLKWAFSPPPIPFSF